MPRRPSTDEIRAVFIGGEKYFPDTDVVGVQPEKWAADPFSGIREDGYIYGRGTLDDKDNVAAGMMVMILLKRLGVPLDRDVIFLAESGEEGTPEVGINFMVEKHWDVIDAEFTEEKD